jgi:leucyl aminopeptidase
MRVLVSDKDLAQQQADLAVCFAHESDREPRGIRDGRLKRELAAQMRAEDFKGRPGDQLVWNASSHYGSRRFLVVGLGPERPVAGEAIRVGCARAARSAAGFAARSLAIRLPNARGQAAELEVRAAVEGAILGAYQFDRYLTDPRRRQVALQTVEVAADGKLPRIRQAVRVGEVAARAVWLARDLVNEAPSELTPPTLARLAAREARAAGLRCKVLGQPELEKLGMGALLAVARGSRQPPRVVHLQYRPSASRTARKGRGKRLVLVGKGVTFDSGGLNLKPGDYMLNMKSDMAGAAAVLAAMTALRHIGCAVEVHALLGLVENMTGSGAYKPGDILQTWSGKTVEVGNTDAEGRLVLCDLLAYAASTIKPTAIVDVATLTGAIAVALGTRITGLFSRSDDLRDALLAAGTQAGEKIWSMPLYDEYLELLQKGPADLCNVGGRWGGAIIAALFLGEFLPRELPWAHLDIAGPAFTERDLPEAPKGATGTGVLTLLRWLEQA